MSRFGNLEFGDESRPRPESRGSDERRYLEAAHAAFANGEFERALRQYSKVLEFNPACAAAWTGQVRMLIELDELREAKVWADKALEQFPHEAELLAAKAVALARSGDAEAAITFSDAAMEEQGETPYLWLARGDVLLARKESRADFCFEKAFLLAPEDWFATWLAARIRFFHEQFALALKLFQQALERNATSFALWLDLGRCQQALGLTNPARHSFTQAKQLNRDCTAASEALVKLDQGSAWTEKLLSWWRRQSKR
jgi:tetratricopeptide (TPR) repeat protein